MDREDCSRREFLRKFAYLSAGALVLSTTTLACYGPPPGNAPVLSYAEVSGIFYLDAADRQALLKNAVDVPLQTVFSIEFAGAMNTSVAPTVSLSSSGVPVSCDAGAWETPRLFSLAPLSDLILDTEYTLSVDAAEDTRGNGLAPGNGTTAVFRTVTV